MPDTGTVGIAPRPADAHREQLHGMWASVAGAWGDYAEFVDARGAAVTARLLELSSPRPGETVLELACGAGGAGLAAAPLVAPEGEVVLSDVVEQMTSIAAARAAALGVDNVSTRVLDLDRLDLPDGSCDVVLCREGLMFALDPEGAVREIKRVLRPGGRLAVAVWGPRERNPWLSVLFDTVSAHLGAPVPPPGVPGPFSLDDRDRLVRMLSGAGFTDVLVGELGVPSWAATVEEWWTRSAALAGPLAKRLETLPPDAVAALREQLGWATRPYQTDGRLEFPGVALLAAGRVAEAQTGGGVSP